LEVNGLLMLGIAYLAGCGNAGYYLVRWRTGDDIRDVGSGSTGARNAARVLGAPGFLIALLADMTKAAVIVALAGHLGCSMRERLAVALAVVTGHIWPVQLGFRGGKGIAPSLGALLIIDPVILGGQGLLFALLFLGFRRWIEAAMLACLAGPFLALGLGRPTETCVGLAFLTALVLAAHRSNFRRTGSGDGNSETTASPATGPSKV